MAAPFYPQHGAHAESAMTAADAVNAFGVELYKKLVQPKENLCISPYSVHSALAMVFAGAAGETREEMARVLQIEEDSDDVNESFAALIDALNESVARAKKLDEQIARDGGRAGDPVTVRVANRLFGKEGYPYRDRYLEAMTRYYGAPLEPIDVSSPSKASARINAWVEAQTEKKIRQLISPEVIQDATRLIVVNALYFKAPWAKEFNERMTGPQPFKIDSGAVEVPMMHRRGFMGYAKRDGYEVVSLAYSGNELQFLVVLPAQESGLAELEGNLGPELLSENAALPVADVDLYLPKLKLEPPSAALRRVLVALGLKTAFDEPPGSADFDGIAPKRPDEYLFISEVIHKTFIAIDEKGTEAAAATAAVMTAGAAANAAPPEPIEVRVDRPFFYAIQHVPTKTALFVGRVADPR